MRQVLGGNVRNGLMLLLAAAALLLLIACVNLASLFTARMAGRSSEFATRAALGAGRGRLVRQVLTESVLTSALGGAAAVAMARWGTQVMVALAPGEMPMRDRLGIEAPVLWFTAAVALLTGILFGLAPALETRRRHLHEELKAGGRSASDPARAAGCGRCWLRWKWR